MRIQYPSESSSSHFTRSLFRHSTTAVWLVDGGGCTETAISSGVGFVYSGELSDTGCIWTIAVEQQAIAKGLLDDLERSELVDLILNVGPLSRGEVAACFKRSNTLVVPTKLEMLEYRLLR